MDGIESSILFLQAITYIQPRKVQKTSVLAGPQIGQLTVPPIISDLILSWLSIIPHQRYQECQGILPQRHLPFGSPGGGGGTRLPSLSHAGASRTQEPSEEQHFPKSFQSDITTLTSWPSGMHGFGSPFITASCMEAKIMISNLIILWGKNKFTHRMLHCMNWIFKTTFKICFELLYTPTFYFFPLSRNLVFEKIKSWNRNISNGGMNDWLVYSSKLEVK